jgi:hypothetical protein
MVRISAPSDYSLEKWLMKMKTNEPNDSSQDHHYLPQFYLRQWAGEDQRLCRFSRPQPGKPKIVAKRVAPKGTGFEPDLYAYPKGSSDDKHAIEHELAKFDSQASNAVAFAITDPSDGEWKDELRRSWSRFLLCQILRTPEDVALIKEVNAKAYCDLDPQEVARRSGHSVEKVIEHQKNVSRSFIDAGALDSLLKMMDHENITARISQMVWSCFQVPKDARSLLTSDRPVWMSTLLSDADALILMPIGPRLLFVAHGQPTQELRPIQELVERSNLLVTEHARRYVYGADDSQERFVQNHFGKVKTPSLLERLARKWGYLELPDDGPVRAKQ